MHLDHARGVRAFDGGIRGRLFAYYLVKAWTEPLAFHDLLVMHWRRWRKASPIGSSFATNPVACEKTRGCASAKSPSNLMHQVGLTAQARRRATLDRLFIRGHYE